MSTKMASHLALEGSITLKVVREGEQSRASCRGSVRGCAPQLPPRPGAAGRFASRPERPASRLPAQPRRFLSLMCRNHGSSIRSVLRRGIGFLENDLSAAARGVVFNESKLTKRVGRPAGRGPKPPISGTRRARMRKAGRQSKLLGVVPRSRETFAGVYATADRVPQSGDRFAPQPPASSTEMPETRRRAGPPVALAGQRKSALSDYGDALGRSWTRAAPRWANIDQDLSRRRKYGGQNEYGNTQALEGWTREWVTRG